MYKKVSTSLDTNQRELNTIEFWKQHHIFEKSIGKRANGKTFTFYDGPPTANGKPHIGHVITRVMKDLIPRYRTMKGYKVLRKAGWDTHGLPVELEVEKTLGISGKPEIETYGVKKFVEKCKESVWTYENLWRNMSERIAFWVDMEHPYVTYHNDYIESVWWSIKKIFDKQLIYKGYKVVPYCPRCGTALSSHEVAQGYQTVTDPSLFVKFALEDEANTFFLAWTTTPWTLPSNVALVVNQKESYVKVKSQNEYYILAKALVSNVLDGAYEIVEEMKGLDLVGTKYLPLFDYVVPEKKAHYIVEDPYVSLQDGTGIVHLAPAFGEDDAKVGMRFDLPFVQLVNAEGKFEKEAEKLNGLFVKEADPVIIQLLKDENKLFKIKEYEHNYPFCWRCHTPLIYYARNTWFIKMTALKNELLKNNEKINWIPDHIKHGRFGNFLENVVDWSLSRERYWGTPLPIWVCDCGHMHAVGSIEELKKMSVDPITDIELHKPYIDQVKLHCNVCQKEMKRVPEVIDCWYDSGAMPFAQWHYPFENKEIFESNFPADFISEAVDQTRGWFYSLLAISTLLFDETPYKNALVLGHVLDKEGLKMSKHKGNVVDPMDIIERQGADAVRFYFLSASAPWLPSRFYEDAVIESLRKFINPLWNSYAFYVLYAEIDHFDPTKHSLHYDKLCMMDRWILSKLQELNLFVDQQLEEYKVTEAARALQNFVDDLSNWYIRRSRDRFWAKGMEQDKIDAFMTLYTVLCDFCKISAPFIPFATEEIYQNIVRSVNEDAEKSIHLCDWPICNQTWIDDKLMNQMDMIIKIVGLGRACRNNASIKNRQPLEALFVYQAPIDAQSAEIIAEELNVKKVKKIDQLSDYINYQFKPQLKTLGPKYGKLLPKISEYLRHVNGQTLMHQLQDKGAAFEIDGQIIELKREDVLVETLEKAGYITAEDGNLAVVLNISLTQELLEEGYVREVISKIQTMRKDSQFDILDQIHIVYEAGNNLSKILEKNANVIQKETLALSFTAKPSTEDATKWNINGQEMRLRIKRA